MLKIDPFIAVKDVNASAGWYQKIFGLKRLHGGNEFGVLVNEDDQPVLCLHKWGPHEHPTMVDPNITAGNGLLLYFKTDKFDQILQNAEANHVTIEEGLHENPNSGKKEFSFRDLDGYFITVTEYHEYAG